MGARDDGPVLSRRRMGRTATGEPYSNAHVTNPYDGDHYSARTARQNDRRNRRSSPGANLNFEDGAPDGTMQEGEQAPDREQPPPDIEMEEPLIDDPEDNEGDDEPSPQDQGDSESDEDEEEDEDSEGNKSEGRIRTAGTRRKSQTTRCCPTSTSI